MNKIGYRFRIVEGIMTSNENFIITGFPLTLKMWFKTFLHFFRSTLAEENKLFKSPSLSTDPQPKLCGNYSVVMIF